ncbi:hypothetical protein OIT44_04190 [Weissella ceti]|uniref:Uncharacterized protein n=1 Tax=Weissella ceti TaxID=759620 RepID=A0ABT3E4I5_9LACO|nr:hypothetical protein [Weissella ceti]MCW0953275.1 hypothetical protein [Weissella ceti]QVK11384.1 hypothetical protein KHQ31_03945 [Weissella ceti]
MTNKITHAPQTVINQLDGINRKAIASPRELLIVFPDISILDDWVYDGDGNYEDKQLAIVNHFFGDEKLQPEREPRYYVQNDTHGNTYWVLSKANVFHDREPAVWDFNMHGAPEYEEGMSETQADLFIQAFGGTKEKLV